MQIDGLGSTNYKGALTNGSGSMRYAIVINHITILRGSNTWSGPIINVTAVAEPDRIMEEIR